MNSPVRVQVGGTLTLILHAQPGAKRTEFAGRYGDALKVRLAAPPVDGKANACLIAFIADYFDVAKSAVSLISGETSRHKLVRVEGATAVSVARVLALLDPAA